MECKENNEYEQGQEKGDRLLFHHQHKDYKYHDRLEEQPAGIARRRKINRKVEETKYHDPLDHRVFLDRVLDAAVHGAGKVIPDDGQEDQQESFRVIDRFHFYVYYEKKYFLFRVHDQAGAFQDILGSL